MKRLVALCLLCLSVMMQAYAGPPAQKNYYQFFLDLTKTSQDQLGVSLITPVIKKKEVVYYLPKIVPGTYANYDFGRFVSNFAALDKKGKALPVEKVDANSWKIKNADKLYQITYTVDDTWDTDIKEDFVFEPGGTSIDTDNYVLNTHGFFGYFADMKKVKYEVSITKPIGFYGSTSLIAASSTSDKDIFTTESYNDLVDAPMMYNRPDTTVLKIGGADILVSVFSPNKVATSKEIAANIKQVLEAQKEYLGGTLPIKKYAFLITLFDKATKSGSMGALEHSYSSLYCLPEIKPERLTQTIRDVSAHEFFHIITPLSIHAEEIGNFDFNQPKMSKHLWLYEGVTEYFAGNMQIKYGLIDLPAYMDVLVEKMNAAEQFNDSVSFTEMSKRCLDEYKDQYGNVYQKGALIGMCLDIKLRSLSGGKYGVQNLMTDLSKTYGKNKSFKDDELFDKIAQLTYPEIRIFFSRYVEGNEPLPFQEMFQLVGLTYQGSAKSKVASLGKVGLGYNPDTQRIIVGSVDQMNEFGKQMGYQEKDELVSLNGKEILPTNAQDLFDAYQHNTKEGDPVEMVVIRKDNKGKESKVTLKAKAILTESEEKHVLSLTENATKEQLAVRDAWLKPYGAPAGSATGSGGK